MLGVQGYFFRSFWGSLPNLAWLAVLVAAALLTAQWVTVFIAPRPVAPLAVGPANAAPATLEEALALFGQDRALTVARIDGLELTGIYATGHRQGFATFNAAEGPLSVVVGAEVRPGLVLAAVESGRAILRGNGNTWQLEMKAAPDLLKGMPQGGAGSS